MLVAMVKYVVLLVLYKLILSCSGDLPHASGNAAESPQDSIHGQSKAFEVKDIFDPWLCDGFAFPFGDGTGGGAYKGYHDNKTYKGWYIATKTGETYSLGIHTGED